jgi:hypothetical protein
MLRNDNTSGNIPGSITSLQISACQQPTLTVPGPLPDLSTIHDGGVSMNSTYVVWTLTGGGSAPNGAQTPFFGTQSCRGSGSNYQENECYHMAWQPLDSPGATAPIARSLQMWVDYTGSIWFPCAGCTNINGASDGHAIDEYQSKWTASKIISHAFGGPHANSPTTSIGNANPGVLILSSPGVTNITGAPWDQHGAGRASNNTDTNPLGVFYTAVPALEPLTKPC